MHTTVGILDPPLGNTRLQVVRLMSAVLQCSSTSIANEVIRLKTFTNLLVSVPLSLSPSSSYSSCSAMYLPSSHFLSSTQFSSQPYRVRCCIMYLGLPVIILVYPLVHTIAGVPGCAFTLPLLGIDPPPPTL